MRDISLRQRALEALSRREHSSVELRRKLLRFTTDDDDLDAVLQALQKEGLLSDYRFAESLSHRRAERYGARRIQLEFEQHGLSAEIVVEQLKALQGSEAERCRQVWQKKFGKLPHDLAERARQTRFLLTRGFSGEVIRRVLDGSSHRDHQAQDE